MFNQTPRRPEGRWARRAYRILAIPLLALLLAACDLDTSAIPPWETSALPAFVCPGDPATLSWDTQYPLCTDTSSLYGSGGCPDTRVDIRSSPADVLGSLFTSGAERGTHVSGPISSSTAFIFNGSVDSSTMDPRTHAVDVVLPDRVSTHRVLLDGTCTAWTSESLAVGEFRSEGVRVVRIRNVNRFDIRVTIRFSTGDSLSFNLLPGEFTPEFEPTLGFKALEVTATRPGYSFSSVDCDTRATYPPPIELDIEMTCGISSTSEAIVAGTPEATTEGEEILELVTVTPQGPAQGEANQPSACRQGPSTLYPILSYLEPAEQVGLLGRNTDGSWLQVQEATGARRPCWVFGDLLDFDPALDLLSALPFIEPPPLPTPTPTTAPSGPTLGCLIYDDTTPNNPTDTICVPRACTPNDQPGGSCTL